MVCTPCRSPPRGPPARGAAALQVRSRFEGAPTAADRFVAALGALGFKLQSRDESDKMFVLFVFVKTRDDGGAGAKKGKKAPAWPPLKACEYKRR